jgi:hypothetical protein
MGNGHRRVGESCLLQAPMLMRTKVNKDQLQIARRETRNPKERKMESRKSLDVSNEEKGWMMSNGDEV